MPMPKLLRVSEVMACLGISRATVYDLIAKGQIPSVKIGRSRRVPRKALKSMIENSSERK